MVTVVCLCEWLLLCVEKVTVMVCAIWGSSEMCQIHVQWSHFWRLLVVCYMRVFRNVPNSRAVVTLLEAVTSFLSSLSLCEL